MANPATSQFNQTVTLTATVKETSGGAVSGGKVTFYDGTKLIGSATVSADHASVTVAGLPVGKDTIDADYGGVIDTYQASDGSTSETVSQDSTSVGVVSSPNPSNVNQSVTLTAVVYGSHDVPTGSVTFWDGTTQLGTGSLKPGSSLNAAEATYATSTLAAGSHSITASYDGDTNNESGTSSSQTQTVNPDTTATSVNSTLNPSEYGQSVTISAQVTDSTNPGTTPAGSVAFINESDMSQLGNQTLSSGTASLTTTELPVGTYSISANYTSSSGNVANSANSYSQTVDQDATTTSLASSENPSNVGDSVTFTATVVAPYDTPSGSVTFRDGSATLGTTALSPVSGVSDEAEATFTTSSLGAGAHSITASYGGDTDNAASSNGLTQTVNAPSASGGNTGGGNTGGSGGSTGGGSGGSTGGGSGGNGSAGGSGSTGSGSVKTSVKGTKTTGKCVAPSRKGKGKGKGKGSKSCTAPGKHKSHKHESHKKGKKH